MRRAYITTRETLVKEHKGQMVDIVDREQITWYCAMRVLDRVPRRRESSGWWHKSAEKACEVRMCANEIEGRNEHKDDWQSP